MVLLCTLMAEQAGRGRNVMTRFDRAEDGHADVMTFRKMSFIVFWSVP